MHITLPGQSSKPSAEGRAPRTMREAFPQFPDSSYEEPSLAQKIADVIVLALAMAAPFAVCIAIGFLFPAQGWI